MANQATMQPVCVTGATGYVASQIVAQLLQEGYRVRGTVRSTKNTEKLSPLTRLDGAAERLELVEADLGDPASFDAAVAGCEVVMHTASPYVLDVKDPQRDLVDPAVEGTRGVLSACKRAGTVKRVVLTSSMAAITDEPDGRVLTEADWNEKSSLERNPYYYSKTLAEKAAWRFVEEEKPGFDLVVLNPFAVIGPSLVPPLNQSNAIFVELLTGKVPAIIELAFGFVDVRDVAAAHVAAMETPGASGRYVCAAETRSLADLVQILRDAGYGDYRLPKRRLGGGFGNWVVKVSSYLRPKGEGTFLRTHIGRVPRFDNGKIQRELGITFRPVEESVRDTVEDLFRWGHVRQRPSARAP